MNVGVFNRVNSASKENTWVMYSEWTSLKSVLQTEENSQSVLHKFPSSVGKDVSTAVVKNLAQNLGINNVHCNLSILSSDGDVLWSMEVIGYGLSLPLSEHDTIKDCVNVYCEWLMALCSPKACVPKPICDDPNIYARRMIQHLVNLFKPRSDVTSDSSSKQSVLCHRVLRKLQVIAQESSMMTRETWEALLLFLLSINDILLSPPTIKDDIGDQMCDRVLSVLFEIWLLACTHCFPTPPLWKTFRDMCSFWRHRTALIEQWNRVNIAVTSRLLKFMYGPLFPELKIAEEDSNLVPVEMTNESVSQTWFRLLHTLSNPVDLCRPNIISQTPKFLHYSIANETTMDGSPHSCLSILPHAYLKAMKGIATLVDAFLGIAQPSTDEFRGDSTLVKFIHPPLSVTPPQQRRITKSFSVSGTTSTSKGHQKSLIGSKSSHLQQQQSTTQTSTPTTTLPPTIFISLETRLPLASARPKCNSILHLFGAWLFEAALVSADIPVSPKYFQQKNQDRSRRANSLLESRRGSGSTTSEPAYFPPDTGMENYEAGRAEAIGALCRIFCAKKTGEEILPIYLARFYLSVKQGLKVGENTTGQVLSSILFNSCDLMRLDLDGVQVLTPHFINALEQVFPEQDSKIKIPASISQVELRRASIHLLLSLLVLPLHFKQLPIKDICGNIEQQQINFQSLRPRLVNLLFSALQNEGDSTNTQMLLGGLLLCVQDAAINEEVEQCGLQQDVDPDSSTTNLLSSGPPSSLHRATYSAHALFVRATYLVCHRLISSWKTDLNVSLAALELLSGLAKIKIHEQARKLTEAMECKRAVKWICDYIVYQCSRPPPSHSKDLHSTIVAAFQCVTTWLVEHPYLLQDKECLSTVLEVVELGISGSKSQPKPKDKPRMKGEKECKPASMRVRDAAEATLTCILDQAGAFPSPCGPESLSSLLDEETLLRYCNSWDGSSLTKEEAIQPFRYYVAENAYVLALLEQPLGNDQDPQPTVTVLIRGPFGRHAWTMQMRHLPRHKSGTKCYSINPGRPLPINDMGMVHNNNPRYFPESVDRIATCKAEKSIPTLESLLTDHRVAQDHEKLMKLMETQVSFEENIHKNAQSQLFEYPNPETECKAPSICQEFQTARLFLSHFGFLSLESLKESETCPVPPLTALDVTQQGFVADLASLDNISSRTYDTVFVFYVKTGQKTAEEILTNINSHNTLNPIYFEFLRSLGWPVDVAKHPGWTGNASNSWKIVTGSDAVMGSAEAPNSDNSGTLYSGQHQILYWSDVSSELAFILPSSKSKSKNVSFSTEAESIVDGGPNTTGNFDRTAPERHSMPLQNPASQHETTKPRTLSLDLEKMPMKDRDSPGDGQGGSKKFGRQFSTATGLDMKVLVVWLESFEDHINFPLGDILQETAAVTDTGVFSMRAVEKDCFIIFIHALQNGLFRIHMQGHNNRISMAIPLVDGMTVSRRALGPLVRQTAINMCRRRRLENEGYQSPHVRRKLKIQEIVSKYRSRVTEAEFYFNLFSNPSS